MKTNILKIKKLGCDEWVYAAIVNNKQEEISATDYDRAQTLMKAPEVKEIIYVAPGCFTVAY